MKAYFNGEYGTLKLGRKRILFYLKSGVYLHRIIFYTRAHDEAAYLNLYTTSSNVCSAVENEGIQYEGKILGAEVCFDDTGEMFYDCTLQKDTDAGVVTGLTYYNEGELTNFSLTDAYYVSDTVTEA